VGSAESFSFPHRCLYCSAHPNSSFDIQYWRGVDLIIVAWGQVHYLTAPACSACARRRKLGRVGWFVLIIGTIVGLGGLAAVGIHLGVHPGVAGCLAGAAMLAGLWWARNRERDTYNRWFAPLYVSGVDNDTSELTVVFRDPLLARETAVLSGFIDAADAAMHDPHDYRHHTAPMPPQWQPAEVPSRRWLLGVVLGLACIAAGGIWYVELVDEPAEQLVGPLALLETIGGRVLVLAACIVIGVAFIAGSLWWRTRKQRHD